LGTPGDAQLVENGDEVVFRRFLRQIEAVAATSGLLSAVAFLSLALL